MAFTTTNNRPHHPFNARSVLRNKIANERNPRFSTARKPPKPLASGMSEEAKEALVMMREDTKENLKSPEKKNSLSPLSLHTMTISGTKDNNNNRLDSSPHKPNLNSSFSKPSLKSNTKAVIPNISNPATARSRSTLSRTIPSTSNSDRNTNKAIAIDDSCAMTNDIYVDDDDDINSSTRQDWNKSKRRSDAEISTNSVDEEDETMSAKDGINDEESQSKPKSFVLALDQALERKCISRLRGDITDTKGISEPGKVRALDGGRLANAQEVVVNVCYDDDRELVFHDDDHESLDTARTISDIRVNLWLEYNKNFHADTDTSDHLEFYYDDETAAPDTSKLQIPCSTQTPRSRESRNTLPPIGARQTTSLAARSYSRGKSTTARKDGNNNNAATSSSNKNNTGNSNIGTTRSKSGASAGSYRDTSSTRIGSAVSTDGSRRSVSSAKKKESFFRRKAAQV